MKLQKPDSKPDAVANSLQTSQKSLFLQLEVSGADCDTNTENANNKSICSAKIFTYSAVQS